MTIYSALCSRSHLASDSQDQLLLKNPLTMGNIMETTSLL